jgi:hypothetical protein
MPTSDAKQQELADLKSRVAQLEQELATGEVQPFAPPGFYADYFATTGFMLGIFGAMASLLANVIGSLAIGQHPLEIIRVYLTFPLGDQALDPSMDSGLALAVGCCLYLATGMVLGVPVYLALARWADAGPVTRRLLVGSVVAVAIWVVNYYVVLSWLQPAVVAMRPENLIVRRIPWWVGCLTHLVFGWTLALVYPWGRFSPYRRPTEQA